MNLVEIFYAENENISKSLQSLPKEKEILDKLLELYNSFYSEINNTVEKLPGDYSPEIIMFQQTHRGFIISIRLILQGAIPEAFTLLSRCAESVAVARKLNKHPHFKTKWITSKSNFRQTLGKKREQLFPRSDKLLYPLINDIYDFTSNHGRHPNFGATITSFKIKKSKNNSKEFIFAYPDFEFINQKFFKKTVNYFILAHINFLKVFIDIFRKNLSKTYIARYKKLIKEFENYKFKLNPLFNLPNQ